MWAIIDGNQGGAFDFGAKYFFEIAKVNILVGANNSGKSYFLRNMIKNIIGIKNKEFFLEKLKDIFQKFNPEDFPFECTDQLSFHKYCINLKKYRESKKYLLTAIKEDKSVTRMSVDVRRHPVDFIDSSKAQIHLDNLKSICNDLSLKVSVNHFVTSAEMIIDQFIPQLDKELSLWFRTDFLMELEQNIDKLVLFEEVFLMDKDFINNLRNENSQNRILPVQIDKNDYDEIDNRIKMYIPINRTLRHPEKDVYLPKDVYSNNLFENRIVSEYKIDKNCVDIFTGLDVYKRYKTALLGTVKERDKIHELEIFLSNMFFENKELSIIPDERTHELKINFDKQKDYPLYNVGDGISSLIIMFYCLFMEPKEMVFIEEPEMNLHPGFQRLFMSLITNIEHFQNTVFFITTHSNHIIDTSIKNYENKNIFYISKDEDKFKISLQNEGSVNLLEALDVLPSSVFLSNKAIWVEGKYDALFIRSLLERHYNEKKEDGSYKNKRYIEGVDYIFIPYSGANRTIIDFEKYDDSGRLVISSEKILEAVNICKDYIFIMDDDGLANGREGKKADFYKDILDKLGGRVHKLDSLEIENLAPVEVVFSYVASEIKRNISIIIDSTTYTEENIIEYMKESIQYGSYRRTKMYNYLNGLLTSKFGENNLATILGTKEGFKVGSSLKNKGNFCQKFVGIISNPDVKITNASEKLLKHVYEFISA